MIALVSFASKCFYKNQERLEASYNKFYGDKIFRWRYKNLVFHKIFWKNLKLFRSKRGAGYWAWTYLIIKKSLEDLNDGDWLIHCDAGLEFIGKIPDSILSNNENSIIVFSSGNYLNKEFTKRDLFIEMGCDSENFWNANQVLGGFQLFKKNAQTIAFVEEYGKYVTQYRLVSDSPNRNSKNFDCFIDHRHTQSILSIMVEKYKIPIFPFPIEGYNKKEDKSEKKFLIANRANLNSSLTNFLKRTIFWY